MRNLWGYFKRGFLCLVILIASFLTGVILVWVVGSISVFVLNVFLFIAVMTALCCMIGWVIDGK